MLKFVLPTAANLRRSLKAALFALCIFGCVILWFLHEVEAYTGQIEVFFENCGSIFGFILFFAAFLGFWFSRIILLKKLVRDFQRVYDATVQNAMKDADDQISTTMAKLGETPKLLKTTQAELEKTQAEFEKTQAELEETQAELGKTQAELEETQAELGKTQAQHTELQNKFKATQVRLKKALVLINKLFPRLVFALRQLLLMGWRKTIKTDAIQQ